MWIFKTYNSNNYNNIIGPISSVIIIPSPLVLLLLLLVVVITIIVIIIIKKLVTININNDKWGRRVAGGIWENYDPKLDQSFTSTGRICKLHREGLYTVITTESL